MYVHCKHIAGACNLTYRLRAAFIGSVGLSPPSSSPLLSLPPHVRGRNLNVFGTLRGAYDGFQGAVQSPTASHSKSLLGLGRTVQRPRERLFHVRVSYTYRVRLTNACRPNLQPARRVFQLCMTFPHSPPSSPPLSPSIHVREHNRNVFGTLRGAHDRFQSAVQ
jgi:hypothetical protein